MKKLSLFTKYKGVSSNQHDLALLLQTLEKKKKNMA